MKRIAILLGVLVGLVVLVILVLPSLVPIDRVKTLAAEQIEAATGRKLTLAGPVSLHVFPDLALRAEDVSLSNAPGGRAEHLAAIKRLDVALQLLPLLSGSVAIDRVSLIDPRINLEIDAKGNPNWRFTPNKAPGESASPKPADTKPAEAPPGASGGAPAVAIAALHIENGVVSYVDLRPGGGKAELAPIDLDLSLPAGGALDAKGKLGWKGETVALTLSAKQASALMGGGGSPVALTVASNPLNVAFDGAITGQTPLAANGKLDIKAASVSRLRDWLGSPGEPPLGALALTGKVAYDGRTARVDDAVVSLEQSTAKGNLALELPGARPKISGKVAVDRIDASPFLSAKGAAGGQPGSAAAAKPAPAPTPAHAGWSEAPIDLSALSSADADLDMTVGHLKLRDLELSDAALKLELIAGRLDSTLAHLGLYKGTGKGRLQVDSAAKPPRVSLSTELSKIDAQPLLVAALGTDRLSGTGDMMLAIETSGASEKAMVEALSGHGGLALKDGTINGLDLVAMVQNAANAFLEARGGSGGPSTRFASLAASFTVDRGIARNQDLHLDAPLLQLTGAGSIDLPRRQISYRIVPRAASGIIGKGIAVPVVIDGPLDAPSYRPDLANAVTQGAEKLIEKLGGKSGGSTSGSGASGTAAPKPADLLRGLLGQ